MSGIGHNAQLRSIVERIERLKEEQDALAADIREVYAEAKSNGYDKTALGQVVTIRRKRAKDPTKFEEQSAIVDLYMQALGMVPEDGTPIATHAHETTPEKPTATVAIAKLAQPEPAKHSDQEPPQRGSGAAQDRLSVSAAPPLPDGLTIDEHGVVQPPPLPESLRRRQ